MTCKLDIDDKLSNEVASFETPCPECKFMCQTNMKPTSE